ncbi:hypothetical protein ZTR_09990 [Talaromyces verruculosus]|nr:hypothetical protein ZTR_09990 [Talaromyces verruculosus]
MSTNFCAYLDNITQQQRIGHLNLEEKTITPLSFLSGSNIENLYQVIEAGSENIDISGEDAIPLSQVKLLPPIFGRDILAVGKNYVEHAKEFHSSGFDSSDTTDQPTHPVIFTKRATSIIASEEEILLHPSFTDSVDYEGEIGVIIGKPGFHISEENALDHVWGYTIINDVTARERQRDHKQFFIGKSPDTYCPIGPVAVPKEKLPKNLEITTHVNGELRQSATLDQLIFSIPRLVAEISQAQTLQVGDTLATGTPVGVGFGFRPFKFLKAGDEVRVSVSGLGSLVNRIATPSTVNHTVQRVLSTSYIDSGNKKTRAGNGLLQIPSGKRLFYQTLGQEKKPPVLFIHGLGGSTTYFAPLASVLSKTHELHLTDLEGHGLSPLNPTDSLSIGSFSNDIKQAYEQRSAGQPATIIAHSMGCLVALKFAIENPHLVSKLVLLGPPATPFPEAAVKGTFARAKLVRSQGMLSVVDAIVASGTSSHSKESNPLAIAAVRLSLLGQDPDGYANACVALARSGSETLDVSHIRAPTMILTGSDDGVSSPAICETYNKSIKGSKLIVLPKVGHWHLFEDTKAVSDAIFNFL